jgi:hypothetical protein
MDGKMDRKSNGKKDGKACRWKKKDHRRKEEECTNGTEGRK